MFKTLIVEDNRLSREALKELLVTHFSSMTVEEASDGKEALRKLDSFRPDLVLMDIRLPDQSGLDLTKQIKAINSVVAVLILSAHHYPEYREMATRQGADGFFVKGGSAKELLAMIDPFFAKAEQG